MLLNTEMYINLCAHPIDVCRATGATGEGTYRGYERVATYPPSGIVARVSVKQALRHVHGGHPIMGNVYGPIVDLPEPVPGVIYLASMLVASRANRADVVGPDSGPSAVKYLPGHEQEGKLFGVLGFVDYREVV